MGNPVVYFEIGCRDISKTGDFYSNLFNWNKAEVDKETASRISIDNKEGIPGHIMSLGHEPHNYVTFYVQVDDLKSYVERVESLGGKTVVPPMEVPGSGHFAWISDPEGNHIGLWQPKS